MLKYIIKDIINFVIKLEIYAKILFLVLFLSAVYISCAYDDYPVDKNVYEMLKLLEDKEVTK